MNKATLVVLAALLVGCQALRRGNAGAGGRSGIVGVESYQPVVGEWDAQPQLIPLDSVAYLEKPYLGRWYGEAYLQYDYHGAYALDGVYDLEVVVRENGGLWAKSNAIEDLGFTERIALRIVLETKSKNIDLDSLGLGEISTHAAYWNATQEPWTFELLLDVHDEEPFAYEVSFRGPNQMVLLWESDGEMQGLNLNRQ